MSNAYVLSQPFPMVGDEIIDVTTTGYKWYFQSGATRVLNWSVSSSKWAHPVLQSTETQADFAAIFNNIAKFINVSFNFLGYIFGDGSKTGYQRAYDLGSDLNISFAYTGTTSTGSLLSDGFFSSSSQTAFCSFPSTYFNSYYYLGAPGDTWLNYNNSFIKGLTYEMGTNGFALVLHEVLHGLGLKHPHDSGGTGRPTYAGLDIKYADRQWISVMSYDLYENGGDGAYQGSQPIGPMLFDAIALQYLYGESSFNSGDTSYDLNRYIGNYYNCQWDAGGVDTLDGRNLSFGIYIDLGLGEASNGTNVHDIGFITTAADYLLLSVVNPDRWTWLWGEYENVIGSSYDDVISGNDFNNDLSGSYGNDYLVGGAGDDRFDWEPSLRSGNDTFVGGLGDDEYVLDSPYDSVVEESFEGIDTIYAAFSYSIEGIAVERLKTLSGFSGNLTFKGNSYGNLIGTGGGDDYLFGFDGSDVLSGGDGSDYIDGGSGVDYAFYGSNYSAYTIKYIQSSGLLAVSDLLGYTDSLKSIEYLVFSDQTVAVSSLLPLNQAPLAANGSASTSEDTKLNGTLPSATDANGDTITYAKATNPSHGSVTVNANGSYAYTPAANYNGLDAFTFTVADGKGGSNTYTQSLTITAVNDAPVLVAALPDQSATAGKAFSYTVPAGAFTDVDSASLTYTATLANGTALPSWLSFNASTRAFSGSPGASDVGTVSVKFTASDGSLSANDTFDLTVVAPIFGTAAGDLLAGTAGNDRVDGGGGLDHFSLSSKASENTVERLPDGTVRVSGPAGIDTLVNVERLVFQDKALAFDVMGIGGTTFRLYQAAYDRAPDASGLGFWMHYLDQGFDLTQAADNFLKSAEFIAIYGDSPTNENYVYLLYKHVHHREPDAGGLQFWIDAMYNKDGAFGKQWTKGEILLKFSESTENVVNLIGVMENGFAYTPFDPGP